MHLIAQHPWLGLGQNAPFTLVVAGADYTHSHNVLTQTMIELGLPGLLLLVALWLATAWLGWRHRQRVTGRLVLWVYASVVLQFDMPQLLDSPRPGWLLVWLPLALALWLELDARRRAAGFDQAALDTAARAGFSNGAFEESIEESAAVAEEFYPAESGDGGSQGNGHDAGHVETPATSRPSLQNRLDRRAALLGGKAA